MPQYNTIPAPAPPTKSPYELERDARIARNERFLASLGLGDVKLSATEQRKREEALSSRAKRGPRAGLRLRHGGSE